MPFEPLPAMPAVTKPSEGISFRELRPDEIAALAPEFASHGGALPEPSVSTAIGMFDGSKLVGYQFLQLKLHAQPTRISPGYSNHFSGLCAASEELIRAKGISPTWVYVFAPEGDLVKLAESRGLTREPWVVLSKLVERISPPSPAPSFLDIPVTAEELEQYPGMELADLSTRESEVLQ